MDGFYKFLSDNSIYIVTFIVLIVWAGVFFYLNSIDKRIRQIEKENKGDNK